LSESQATASCPSCGREVPADAAFCPACGTRLDAGATERAELPANETGRVPVSVVQVQPRLFGVTPPTLLFGLAAVALTVGGFLIGLGHWVWAIALFAVAVALLAGFLRVARRKPDAAFARTSVEAVDSIRARAGYAAQALRTRSTARREVLRLRTELLRLAARREELLRELGGASYRNERQAVKALKADLTELDGRETALEDEIEGVTDSARRNLDRAALEVQPTEIQSDSPPPTED
jgi:hypothetical protein